MYKNAQKENKQQRINIQLQRNTKVSVKSINEEGKNGWWKRSKTEERVPIVVLELGTSDKSSDNR